MTLILLLIIVILMSKNNPKDIIKGYNQLVLKIIFVGGLTLVLTALIDVVFNLNLPTYFAVLPTGVVILFLIWRYKNKLNF